ncbi:MAG: hypothetical protein ABIP85_14165 [Chthoniobacteraceae bacterium]
MHGGIKADLLIDVRIWKEAVIAMKAFGHFSKPVFNDGVAGQSQNVGIAKQRLICESIEKNGKLYSLTLLKDFKRATALHRRKIHRFCTKSAGKRHRILR